MKELSLQTVVVRGSEHVETRVGDQTLMMSVAHGKYYSVDATAGRIWEMIEQPIALSEVVSDADARVRRQLGMSAKPRSSLSSAICSRTVSRWSSECGALPASPVSSQRRSEPS